MVSKQKYVLALSIIMSCMSKAMDNAPLEVEDVWPSTSAQKIAYTLYNHVEEALKIKHAEDILKSKPKNVKCLIVDYIEALKLSEKENDDIFDAYLALHRLRTTWTVENVSEIICYKLSHDGKKLAFAGQEKGTTRLHVAHQDDITWKSKCWVFTDRDDERIRHLKNIYWATDGRLYTLHNKKNTFGKKTKYVLEWKEERNDSYSISARHVPKDWHNFYQEYVGVGIHNNSLEKDAAVEGVTGNKITASTVVSWNGDADDDCIPAMERYLKVQYDEIMNRWLEQ